MNAVTIISPSYRKVGKEAVRRMERFAGVEVKALKCADRNGFVTKLNLDRLCPQRPMMFFDCDLWSLRKWEPSMLGSPCFHAVHDAAVWNCHTFCHHDTHQHGLDPLRYFNSGLFFWDNSRPEHRSIFRLARKSWTSQKKGRKHYEDKTDQAHLNYGLLQSGVPLQWLPVQYNTYCFGVRHGQMPYYPRDIINLHGAGIVGGAKKYSRLKVEASVFGAKIYPMHQQAVNFAFDKQYLHP
jgi:hypothetical protein